MSEQNVIRIPEEESRKLDILRITPAGQDPLIYWHQVAQDAIRSAEKERERAKAAVAGREKAERDLKDFTDHVISMATNRAAAVPLDLTRLIEKVELGDIDLNLSLYISRARE